MTRILPLALVAVIFPAACGDNAAPTAPDAAVMVDATPVDSSCGWPLPDDCCRFEPDAIAVAACVSRTLPTGQCETFACQKHDCSLLRVDVCGAPLCADIGCPSALCNAAGECVCETPSGPVACVGAP